ELELLAVLGADAVGAALPACGLEDLVGLLDVELPLRVLRDEPRRRVHEIGGGDAGAPVDLLLYRAAVDQEIERLAHGEIAQDRVLGLDRRPLAVDLRPRIGEVELDVLDVPAGDDVGAALAALLPALQDLVLDLHVPGVVEL